MQQNNLLNSLTDNITVDKNKCIYCGKCADTCILDNIRIKLAPCRAACPLGINIQGYVQLIHRGQYDEARALIEEKLPFASILCRICDHPCQSACRRNAVDGTGVDINGLKRWLFAGRKSKPIAAASPSGRKVAIIGSGPAALMACFELLQSGHAVTVYESSPKPGGLLRSMLPLWKLPESILDEEIERLEKAGAVFRCSQSVSANEREFLKKSFDAVILATGAGRPKTLACAKEAEGVLQAFDLLAGARSGHAPELGGHAVILGGGRVALDAAQAALRQGAKNVSVIYRRTADKFHADRAELASAKALGIRFAFTWEASSIKNTASGYEIACRHNMDLLNESCLDYPDFDAGEVRLFHADHVILAVGQEEGRGVEDFFGGRAPSLDPVALQFEETNVFAAGDAVSGPSSAVSAMASGREAAESVIRMFSGRDMHYQRTYAGPFLTSFPIDERRGSSMPPQQAQGHAFSGAGDYAETNAVFTEEQARAEASRCLSCGGPEGHFKTCWFCLPCEVECPKQAIWVNIPYLLK